MAPLKLKVFFFAHEALIKTSDDTPTTSSSFKTYVCYLEAFREIVIFPVSSEV